MLRRTRHDRIGLALLAACCAMESVVRAQDDWAMFRGNQQQSGVARSALPEKLDLVWRVDLKEPILSTAAIVGRVVYVGTDDGSFVALHLADGKEKWRIKLEEGIRSSPTALGDSIYFGDQEGKFRCLIAADGKEKWIFATGGEIVSSANHQGGSIVFGSYDGFIYALDANDGSLRWKFETAGRVHGTPAIVEDAVIAAGCDEYLHVLSLKDGVSLRKVPMGSVSGASAPVEGSMTVIGTYGNSVIGVDWKEAKVVWTFTDPERQFPFMSSAALISGAAFIGGRDKRLRSLNAGTGAVNWTFGTDGKVESSPVVVGTRVFFGSGDGNVYALEAASGSELWRYETGGPISASPAVAHEKLIIGNEDGLLHCFGTK